MDDDRKRQIDERYAAFEQQSNEAHEQRIREGHQREAQAALDRDEEERHRGLRRQFREKLPERVERFNQRFSKLGRTFEVEKPSDDLKHTNELAKISYVDRTKQPQKQFLIVMGPLRDTLTLRDDRGDRYNLPADWHDDTGIDEILLNFAERVSARPKI